LSFFNGIAGIRYRAKLAELFPCFLGAWECPVYSTPSGCWGVCQQGDYLLWFRRDSARALDITFPPTLLALADEVIE
jgi:hypothetical protein